ncbi:nickel-responsive transcriptional regulator NikR [Afifella pfennigii]|uniref:nickel-responsive transcriptional regulator NikR n=1 Tax=Afifella pfennigii TaxID=209897 RepID=UPI00047D41CA|nr:nickel-responsive transcriptional regulator NikR [Afifella pfennigii]
MQRVTITMTDEIADKLDRFMKASGAQNRSEAIRDLVRRALTTRSDVPPQSACLAVLSCALDQSSRNLAGRVPQSRLDRHDQNIAALSIPLDHTTSLEVAVMRGRVGELTGAAESLFLERGVMHGSLALIPIGEDSQRHAHGDNAYEHTHLKVQSAF